MHEAIFGAHGVLDTLAIHDNQIRQKLTENVFDDYMLSQGNIVNHKKLQEYLTNAGTTELFLRVAMCIVYLEAVKGRKTILTQKIVRMAFKTSDIACKNLKVSLASVFYTQLQTARGQK